MVEDEKNTISIKCHKELIEILNKLDPKINEITWGAIKNVGYPMKTLILARKIKASKLNL